jgi:DNA-binding winged helix-turn-helix (wHTH) protein
MSRSSGANISESSGTSRDVVIHPTGGRVRFRFGEFVLDAGSRQLLRGDGEVHLEPKALDLLELLLAHRPNALTKSRIRDRLWPRTSVSDSSVTTLVAELRETLGDDARRPRYVRTAYGFGYAFCGDAPW